MIRTMNAKTPYLLLLTFILLILSALPVHAAATPAPKAVEVRVKIGSGQMSANGEKIKIQPPYNSGKIAMVPLSVFTNAKGFGATLKPSGTSLKLTHLKHTVVLTKGSKAATVDGKKTTLPVAPADKAGVTMVPLDAISKALGFKTSTDAKTKELVVKGTSASPGASGSGIDSDAGKNKVGDSYYKWSMNLPTNLAQDEQWSKGSRISFADVKGEFYMAVYVDEAKEPLDAEEQRELLKRGVYGRTLVDVSAVTRGTDTFQRLVMKDDNGFFYEYRGIQRNGNFYTVVFGKKAKSKAELDAYKTLLDSFRTSFDSANKSLKDLTIVNNGKISYANATYGLQLKLPVSWNENVYYDEDEEAGPSYEGPEDETLKIIVNSVMPGDTIDAWVERDVRYLEDMILEPYRKVEKIDSITWNGVPAKAVYVSFSEDAKNWTHAVSVYAMKGDYKYDVTLSYPQERKAAVADVLQEMTSGLKIDFAAVENNFGQVPDENDTRDVNVLVTKTSKAYGYSITVPKHWIGSASDMEESEVTFESFGNGIYISIEEGALSSQYEDGMEEMFASMLKLKLESKTKVTLAGAEATRIRLSSTEASEVAGTVDVYLFEKNGNTFMLMSISSTVSATPLNTKQLEDALNSFKFN